MGYSKRSGSSCYFFSTDLFYIETEHLNDLDETYILSYNFLSLRFTMILKRFLFIVLLGFGLKSNISAQEVQVVIAAGLDWAATVAISPNKQFVAKTFSTALSIWDVKTGRMLRNVTYSQDYMKQADSIYFSPDSKTIITNQAFTNDQFHINVETGESIYKEGTAFDYSNYKYEPTNASIASIHLYDKSMKDIEFPSPDGNTRIVYKKVKNTFGATDVMPFIYTSYIKQGAQLIGPIDTTLNVNFVFSEDSKYLFTGHSIYDLELKRKVQDLKIVPFTGRSVAFVPGSHIPVTAVVDGIRIWKFPDVNDIPISNFVNFKTSNDGKWMICEKYSLSTETKEFIAIDLIKKKQIGKVITSKESSILWDASPDGKMFTFLEMTKNKTDPTKVTSNTHICDSRTGKKIKTLNGSTKAYFGPKGENVLTDSAGLGVFKFNLLSGSMEKFPKGLTDKNAYLHYVSQDHHFAFTTYSVVENLKYTSRLQVWDIETGALFFEKDIKAIHIGAIQVNTEHSLLTYASSENNHVYVIDMKTKQEKFNFKGHLSMVDESKFSEDSERLITSSLDGTRRIWNLVTGKEMVSLISTGPNDFAIVNPDQYYYATKGAQKLIHFVKGVEVFPFAQFDLKYNRPDIIIQSLEASNLDLIGPFKKAYEKRLKKMGFTEDMLNGNFQMPVAEVTNEADLPIITTEGKIELDVAVSDSEFNLDRIIVRVNEVPLNGTEGLSLRSMNLKSTDQKIPVQLSNGKNTISVSVLNEKGVESIAHTVTIDYQSKGQQLPNLYLLSVGASKYKDEKYNLTYAAKDAQDVSDLFKSSKGLFNEVIIKTATNEEVSSDLIKSWKKDLKSTTVDDIVCVFYAGHGILDADLNYYLASYQIDFENPNVNGIPYEVFENLLDGIPARRKLMMIDACHSGEIDKEELVAVEENFSETKDEDLTFRAINSSSTQNLGLNNSFELMKELFTDIRKSSGAVIISSAGGLEFAIEGDDWNNGVFTYSFLTGITDKKADLNGDGFIYLSEMNEFVRTEVFTLTKGKQQPTNRTEVLESDWRMW